MISVVTASYNYEKYIGETIQSVLDQTYRYWELIIVDDCSTDNSVEVIKSFKDDRIKLFVNEQNLGLSKTVQRAIKEASGEWIVFLESDDLITPDYLEKKVKIADEYKNVNLIFNDCELFGEDEKRIESFNNNSKFYHDFSSSKTYPRKMFYDFFNVNRILTFSAVMAKREDLLKLDFSPKYATLLDWHLWIQMAYRGEFYYIKEKLTKWRMHKDSYIHLTKKSRLPKVFEISAYYCQFKMAKDYTILLYITFVTIKYYLGWIKYNLRKRLIPQKREN